MKTINLTKGKVALVDDMDFEFLNQWRWHVTSNGYVARKEYLGGGRKNQKARCTLMHRVILSPEDSQQVDHVDFNKLNNQKSNIRICSRSENQAHRKKQSNNTTGFKGVHLDGKNSAKYRARIVVNRKGINLGCFDSKEGAAKAYNEASIKYRGTFALLNVIPADIRLTPTTNTTRTTV